MLGRSLRNRVIYTLFLGVTVYIGLLVVLKRDSGGDSSQRFTKEQGNESTSSSSSLSPSSSSSSLSPQPIPFIPKCFKNISELNDSPNSPKEIWRLRVECNASGAFMETELVSRASGLFSMDWEKDRVCMQRFIDRFCYENVRHTVPNVIHYVWFGNNTLKPDTFISVLSTIRYQQPCAILFHAEFSPRGPYWDLLLAIVPNIIHVVRKEPESIFGKKFGYVQHKSDVVRLEVLRELGGIYLDSDQLLLRNVKELMNESFVMSHENKGNLANSMMLSSPGAHFIELWYTQYRGYIPHKWGYHSTYVPWNLAKKYPASIKVVGNRFVYPDLPDIRKLYTGYHNINNNYGLHLYSRVVNIPLHLPDMTRSRSTVGDVCRAIVYGRKEMFRCPEGGGGLYTSRDNILWNVSMSL